MLLFSACTTKESSSDQTLTPAVDITQVPAFTPAPSLTPTEVGLRGTIRIWHSWDESDLPVLVKIIEDYQITYPDVLFDVQYIPGMDLLAQFQAASSEKRAPSILLGSGSWGSALYEAGFVEDLSKLASEQQLMEINQPALEGARAREAIYGLPFALQGVVLFRNVALIPQAPSTFADLVLQAQAITSGEIIGAYLERSFYYSGASLLSLGGQLMNEDGSPAFNSQQGVAWLNLLGRYEEAGLAGFQTDEDLETFKDGKVGFIIDGTWNAQSLAEAIGEEFLAIDPWPAIDSSALSGFLQSENVYLSTQVSVEEQTTAWRFIEYFISPDVQSLLAETNRIPARQGSQVSDPLLAQAAIALAGGQAYPAQPVMDIYISQLDLALVSVFQNSGIPEEALKVAQDTISQILQGRQISPPSP